MCRNATPDSPVADDNVAYTNVAAITFTDPREALSFIRTTLELVVHDYFYSDRFFDLVEEHNGWSFPRPIQSAIRFAKNWLGCRLKSSVQLRMLVPFDEDTLGEHPEGVGLTIIMEDNLCANIWLQILVDLGFHLDAKIVPSLNLHVNTRAPAPIH